MRMNEYIELIESFLKEEKRLVNNLINALNNYKNFIAMKELIGKCFNGGSEFDMKAGLKQLLDQIDPEAKNEEAYKSYFEEAKIIVEPVIEQKQVGDENR